MKKTVQLILFLFIFPFIHGCAQKDKIKVYPKINGVSFVASRIEVQQEHIDPLLNINANYSAIMPFGFIKTLENPEIVFNTDRQWFGETKAGAKQYIEILHKNNIKVMIKPQIWIWRGEFTGYLKMASEEDWIALESSYKNFILTFAELAQESEVEIFCIGTELEQFIVHRPLYWNSLIKEIKSIYKGKLTYAANWDEYKRVPFWKDMDYIGVDGYFPVSNNKTPSIEDARLGWKQWKSEMKSISELENKKILFTEYGYRSINFTGKEPWKSDHDSTNVNHQAQINTTKALYDELWSEDWFAGGFLWKWFVNHAEVGGIEDNFYTPQNKPVEAIIKENYLKNN